MRTFLIATVLCVATVALAQADKTEKTEKKGKEVAPLDISKLPFTQASIRKVVTHHQPQIQGCYEETLAGKDKVVEGKLLTSFVITVEGLVRDAKVEKKVTTLHDPKLHECVVAVLSTMTFPKPVDTKEHPIEYPFNLKAIQ